MKLGWILLGTAAVGGVGYYLYTRNKTPAGGPASIPPAGGGTASLGPAPNAAANYPGNTFAQQATVALSSGVAPDGTLLSNVNIAAATNRAVTLAGIGHGDREGLYWALIVAGSNPTPTQLSQLRAAGYKV